MEIFLSKGREPQSLFLEILCSYSKLSERKLGKVIKMDKSALDILQIKNTPLIIKPNSKAPIAENEIVLAKEISAHCCVVDLLFGRTDEERKTIEVFLNHIIADLKYDHKALMTELNLHLLLNTFINGSFSVTACDLLSFAIIAPCLNSLSNEEKTALCNVIRWADHIQNLNGIKETTKELKISFSTPYEPFILPDRSVPVQKKEKGKDKDKEGKKDKEKAKNIQPETKKKELHLMSKVDIRVGKVVSIVCNPEADKLFNEEIDIGNGEIRKIASGLRNRVDINALKDSLVVVICNLEPRKLKGWDSHGMILCASIGEDKVEPLRPPKDCQPGDLVTIGDLPREPAPDKKNPWSKVCKDLIVNDKLQATYKGEMIWATEKGPITSTTLANATIS